eukprot:scaffold5994_cov54-Phaeocystis_antarctica.AAC.11
MRSPPGANVLHSRRHARPPQHRGPHAAMPTAPRAAPHLLARAGTRRRRRLPWPPPPACGERESSKRVDSRGWVKVELEALLILTSDGMLTTRSLTILSTCCSESRRPSSRDMQWCNNAHAARAPSSTSASSAVASTSSAASASAASEPPGAAAPPVAWGSDASTPCSSRSSAPSTRGSSSQDGASAASAGCAGGVPAAAGNAAGAAGAAGGGRLSGRSRASIEAQQQVTERSWWWQSTW